MKHVVNKLSHALAGAAQALQKINDGDVLVIWKLDRMGRSLHHLVKTVAGLSERGIGLKVLTGQGAQIDTTTAHGRLSFGIFASLAEFESELIRERTMAGLAAARARGRKGGRKFALTKAQLADLLFDQIGLNKRESKDMVDAFFDLISERLAQGQDVKLSGFGNFQIRTKAPRPGRNPRTGEAIPIQARRVVTFHASSKLKEQIQGGA